MTAIVKILDSLLSSHENDLQIRAALETLEELATSEKIPGPWLNELKMVREMSDGGLSYEEIKVKLKLDQEMGTLPEVPPEPLEPPKVAPLAEEQESTSDKLASESSNS